jgi:bacterial leucyl aminopeptidase
MKSFLTKFTTFKNRYYKSASGRESCDWLFEHLNDLSTKTHDGVKLSVKKFAHEFGQSSIIARLETDQPADAPIVILSSHQGKQFI